MCIRDSNKEFKNIFDLYLTDSTVDKKLTPSKTVTDSMAEFAQGKAAVSYTHLDVYKRQA